MPRPCISRSRSSIGLKRRRPAWSHPTGGGAAWLVERVIDPRRASWSTFVVGFARTEPEAIVLARKARADASIWLQPHISLRRARRVPEERP